MRGKIKELNRNNKERGEEPACVFERGGRGSPRQKRNGFLTERGRVEREKKGKNRQQQVRTD